jgi:hypothetical protein
MDKRLMMAAGAMAFGLASTASPPAHSDTLAAVSGHAWIAGEQGCFGSSWSMVQNFCGGSRKFLIAAPSRWTGNTRFTATAQVGSPNDGNRPGCRAVVNSANNSFVAQSGLLLVSASGTTLGTLPVNSGNTQHFDCDLRANGLASVGWAL